MLKHIFLSTISAIVFHAKASEKINWVYCSGEIDQVYVIESSQKETELIRIYNDGVFEHLKYSQISYHDEIVERALGTYTIKKDKITFHAPKKTDLCGAFQYGSFHYNGKLYRNRFDLKFRKNREVFRKTKNKKYFKPFFVCLNSDEVINNEEAGEQIDLKRLITFIISDTKTEEDRVMAIIRLIAESMAYDYEGLYSDHYANNQSDIKSMLAGKKRVAVCAGYSKTFAALCEIAGIKAKYVTGNTRQGFGDIGFLGGYHAWNHAEISGKRRLYDVTWADDGSGVDLRWIDVDPKIMISSHLPDYPEDQLLSVPISPEQFLSIPVILPLEGGANHMPINVKARQFGGKNFRIALPGRHTIKVDKYDAGITELVYRDENNEESRMFYPKNIGSGHYDGDSTYFIVPLTDVVNPLDINVDGQFEVHTVVFRGGETDLMKHYIKRATTKHCDAYIKGLIAAIKLGDEAVLKSLSGDQIALLFDKKGRMKIDKRVMDACRGWTGNLTSRVIVTHYSPSLNKNDEFEYTEAQSMHIDVPNKLRLQLSYDGEHYLLINIEIL